MSPMNHGRGLWVRVMKPVWYIVKGLRLKGLETPAYRRQEQPNPLTKRAS